MIFRCGSLAPVSMMIPTWRFLVSRDNKCDDYTNPRGVMTDHSSLGHVALRALLGVRSDELVGAACEPTADDAGGFTVDRL